MFSGVGWKTDVIKDEKKIEMVAAEVLKQLSHLANSVVAFSAKLLSTSSNKLQNDFEETYKGQAEDELAFTRSFLEHCCFKALAQLTQREDYLQDYDFRRFTFDFMVVWEEPFASGRQGDDKVNNDNPKEEEDEADDQATSLFFSDLMPLLVEVDNTVQVEAFARIAPCISILADAISAYPQFETLTASTSGRLPFPVYNKYIEAISISLRKMKDKNEFSFLRNLPMSEEEHVLEVDGTSQIVIQHIDSKSTPGRLTLTDHCLYFEPSSILSHRDAIKYDLSAGIDHTVTPQRAGPWGSRVFDTAISYKTSSPENHAVFEFPEVVRSRRRDYWIALIQEVIDTHRIIRKHHLEGACKLEALARSVLGVVRLQAMRGCMQLVISNPGALLTFNLAENILRGGDCIMDALANTLKNAAKETGNGDMELDAKIVVQGSSIQVLESVKIWRTGSQSCKLVFYKVIHGAPNLIEKAVKEARESSRYIQNVKKKEEEVKLDGIGMNVALMKELLRPAGTIVICIRDLGTWRRPLHTMISFIVVSVIILRGWLGYIVPILIAAAAVLIIWLKISGKAVNHREVVVQIPGGISLDQVITAHSVVTQLEGYLQAINVMLLKVMAIIIPIKPKAATYVPIVLFGIAMVLVTVPIKYLVFALHVGLFAFSLRDKTKENKVVRRLRELWHSVPPLPVRMVDSEPDKENDT